MRKLILLAIVIIFISPPNKAMALAWNEIDSPNFITKHHLTGSQEEDRKIGNIIEAVNNVYALTIVAYKTDKNGFGQYFATAGSSFLIMGGMKEFKIRKRPDRTDRNSLPSGHVIDSFLPVGFLYYRYGIEYAILPAISGALVAYSRVEIKKHYITDTLASAAISILVGKFFTTSYSTNDKLSIKPVIDKNYRGLEVRYEF